MKTKSKDIEILMNKNNHIVYVHTTPSGKRYVGQTTGNSMTDYNRRFKNGKGYKSSIAFYNAIKKYGWDNIITTIIVDGLSQEDANELEIRYISILRTTDRRYGYNISLGGGGWNKGKDCHNKDYRKDERNELRRKRYNMDEEYKKFYNQRANEYRKKSQRYKEYQKEYQKEYRRERRCRMREEYLQSDEYKEKLRIKEQKKLEKEHLEEQQRMEKEKIKNERHMMHIQHKKEYNKTPYMRRMRYIDNRIRRASLFETKQKWIEEREKLKAIHNDVTD